MKTKMNLNESYNGEKREIAATKEKNAGTQCKNKKTYRKL